MKLDIEGKEIHTGDRVIFINIKRFGTRLCFGKVLGEDQNKIGKPLMVEREDDRYPRSVYVMTPSSCVYVIKE